MRVTPNTHPRALAVPMGATLAITGCAIDGPGVFYANCTAARETDAAPIDRGEPSYRQELDRDDDGIACD